MFYQVRTQETYSFTTGLRFADVEEAWKRFLPEGHHLICGDLPATELSEPEDLSFRYVSIFRNGEQIGVMYLQCLRFGSRHYRSSFLEKKWLSPLRECLKDQHVNLMICGNLFRVNFQGFWFRDKADRALIFDCLHLYRQQHEKNNSHCGILVKDCSRSFTPEQLSCQRFRPFDRDMTMELELRPGWRTFDDYLGDLSRKYRQRASKILRSLEGIEVRELGLSETEAEKEQLERLYSNIVSRQHLALGILPADYFVRMKEYLGDRFRISAYYLNGKMVAFCSRIHYPGKNRMEIHYIGMDYEANKQHNLYFNILFLGIREAIDYRYSSLEMGRTAREAKASAGAHAVENLNYIWIRPGMIRLLFQLFSNRFEQSMGNEWKNRYPFRTSPSMEGAPVPEQKGPIPDPAA